MPLFRRSYMMVIILVGLIALLSSFIVPLFPGSDIAGTDQLNTFLQMVKNNLGTIFLILSELAALLPGPWNGILQTICRGLSKVTRRKKS